MIAADFVAELEARFLCVQGVYRVRCQTGDDYVCFRIRAKTEDEAVTKALREFNAYERSWRNSHRPGSRPVLYWRYGEMHAFYQEGAFHCRLVLSDRPVVEETDEQYDANRTAELERQHFGEPDEQRAGQSHLEA